MNRKSNLTLNPNIAFSFDGNKIIINNSINKEKYIASSDLVKLFFHFLVYTLSQILILRIN